MTPKTTLVVSKVSEAENNKLLGWASDIETLRSSVFDDLLASDVDVAASALRIGQCAGLLGVALENITLDSPGNKTQALDATSREQRS